jgi:hypothetical protein
MCVAQCPACARRVSGKIQSEYGRPADAEYKVQGQLVGVDTFNVGYKGKPTIEGKRLCTVIVDYATQHVKNFYKTKTQRLQMFRNFIGWAASQGGTVHPKE